MLLACGDSDNEQNPNPGTSTQTTGGDASSAPGGEKTTEDKKKALGAACEKADECESNNCREISIDDPTKDGDEKITTKTCSACNADADCKDPEKGNLCVPALSSLSVNSLHYACGKGELGGGCLDNNNCSESRVCGEVLGGFKTCGECVSDQDCSDAAKPTCVLKQEGTLAYRHCGAKLEDGERCSGGPDSDGECKNFCASIKNNLVPVPVGVCSPCKEDSNCADGEKCTPPTIDIGSASLTAAKCEPKDAGGTETGTTTGSSTEMTTTAETTSTDSTT